jgi:dolichol kinase
VKFIRELVETVGRALKDEKILIDLRRKGARLLVGSIMIPTAYYTYNQYGIEIVRNITLVMVLLVIAADYLRLSYGMNIPFLAPFVTHAYEKEGFQGATYAVLGVLLALSFADFDIGITAVAMFMYGDAVASIFGTIFGKTKIMGRGKTIVGSMAMLIVSVLVGRIMLKDIHTSIFMALLATVVELSVFRPADDFAIPIFTAMGGQFFGAVLGQRKYLEGFQFALLLFVVSTGSAVFFVGAFNLVRRLIKWLKRSST